jgi:hypothetical protein
MVKRLPKKGGTLSKRFQTINCPDLEAKTMNLDSKKEELKKS